MANWCRTVLRVLGPEPDVARFAALVVQDEDNEEGSLTQLVEICEMERSPGRAKCEVLTKWRPPLDALTAVSRQFSALRFQADWQEPSDHLVGCAVIADGDANVMELDDLVRRAKNTLREAYRQAYGDGWDSNTRLADHAYEAETQLEWEILGQSSRLFCGEEWEEQGEHEDNGRRDVRELARLAVRDAFDATKRDSESQHCWWKEGF